MRRYRKLIVVALVTIAVVSFLIDYLYFSYLVRASPTASDPSRAQVETINNHGTLYFVTANQKRVGWVARLVFAATGLCAGVLNIRWKIFPSTSRYPEHENIG